MELIVPILGIAGMALVGLVVFVAMRPGMQRKSQRKLHNAALAELAKELRLDTTPGEDLDRLGGPLGRIKIGIVPVHSTDRARVEAGLLTRGRLCIRRRGSSVSGAKTGPPTPTGDAAFDQGIEVLGASAALRAALGDRELKALVRRVIIDQAGVAVHNEVAVERPLASSVDELRDALQTVVTLARWLNEPSSAREYLAGAPLVPPFQKVAEGQRARAFLEAVGPRVGDGKLVEGDDGLEWRCRVESVPLRIVVDGDDVRVQVKANLPLTNIELNWDPDEIPEPHGDAWDESDAKVFVAHGVTISKSYDHGASPEQVFKQRCADWARVPAATQADMVATMSSCDVRELIVGPSGMEAQLRRGLQGLLHPQAQLQGLARGLVRSLAGLATLPPPTPEAAGPQRQGAQAQRDKCRYCHSLFVWTTKAECPNCGAPLGS